MKKQGKKTKEEKKFWFFYLFGCKLKENAQKFMGERGVPIWSRVTFIKLFFQSTRNMSITIGYLLAP